MTSQRITQRITRRITYRTALSILLAIFVGLAFAYSVAFPLGEAPDEVSHWAYVQYLSAEYHFPTAEGAVLGEAHQPPLYYLVVAAATFWVPQQSYTAIANPDFTFDNPQTPNLLLHPQAEAFPYHGFALAWHLARWLSIVMGAVTVWATWRLGGELFSAHPGIALSAAAFVAFLPEFTFISSVVNNDSLVVMLSSLGLLQLVRMIQHPIQRRDLIALGVLLGLAPLAKLSGLVMWLFAAAIFFALAYKTRRWKAFALDGVICFGLAALIVTPWMVYNWQRFGDPLGWSFVLSVTPVRQGPLTWDDGLTLVRGLWSSFWGRFGGALHLRMADAVYGGMGLAALVALVGWIGYAADARRHTLTVGARQAIALLALFWLLMLVSFVRWSLAVLGTDQARQLFPGLPLLAVVLAAGLARLFRPREQAALAVWSGSWLTLGLVTLWVMGAVFTVPPQNPETLPRLSETVFAPVDLGQTIRILEYHIANSQVRPGNSVMIQVYWQALAQPQKDYWILFQLANAKDVVANQDSVPTTGRLTTDRWNTGQVFTSTHSFTIPKDVQPGTYTLRLGLHPFGQWEWLPVNGQDHLTLGTIQVQAP